MIVDVVAVEPVVPTVWPGAASRISDAVRPPPAVDVAEPADRFELVAGTLPVELDAELVAATVAAVERSPDTAANEAWNFALSRNR